MLDADVFSHTGANGSSPGDRMTDSGYVFQGSSWWGENIAYQGTGNSLPVGPAVTHLHQNLFVDMNTVSRGHRLNICNSAFREIGIGVSTGTFTQNGHDFSTVMITQDFAAGDAKTPGPFLVGVVYRDSNGDGSY